MNKEADRILGAWISFLYPSSKSYFFSNIPSYISPWLGFSILMSTIARL